MALGLTVPYSTGDSGGTVQNTVKKIYEMPYNILTYWKWNTWAPV